MSTRKYERVVPELAERCGVSRSAVSRHFVESRAKAVEQLCERRFDGRELLLLYLDGVQFGEHHVVVALGVDDDGKKHVLGLAEGATENAVVVKALLTDLVERGVRPDRAQGAPRLFVIDGSKALRKGIAAVYGAHNFVQRCRKHKVDNVVGSLPEYLRPQVRATMRAAYRLHPDEGMKRLRTQAEWLEQEHPSAAASLLEGLEETFTLNRLDLPEALRRCLVTTNLIESAFSGTRSRSHRVTHWQDGKMTLRWAAAAALTTEANFRRVMGYEHLWMLRAKLDDGSSHRKEVALAA